MLLPFGPRYLWSLRHFSISNFGWPTEIYDRLQNVFIFSLLCRNYNTAVAPSLRGGGKPSRPPIRVYRKEPENMQSNMMIHKDKLIVFALVSFINKSSSNATTFSLLPPLVLNHQVSGGSFLYLASKKDNGFLSSLITSTASLSSGQFKEGQSTTAGMFCLWPLHF